MSSFIKKKITIRNLQGLHARPASIFVRIANKFESEILVKKDDEIVSGKSIMGLLTLAANQGTELEVEISGNDAEAAMKALEEFLTGEDDGKTPPPAAPRKDVS